MVKSEGEKMTLWFYDDWLYCWLNFDLFQYLCTGCFFPIKKNVHGKSLGLANLFYMPGF